MSKKEESEKAETPRTRKLECGQQVTVLEKMPGGEWLTRSAQVIYHDAKTAAVIKPATRSFDFIPMARVYKDQDEAVSVARGLNKPAPVAPPQ